MSSDVLWKHQREELDATRDAAIAAIHWEPRLGKSRLVIETVLHLLEQDKIDALLVIAPSGVHLNWTREQIPLYWRGEPPRVLEWSASRAGTRRFRAEMAELAATRAFAVVAAGYEAATTKTFTMFARSFSARRRAMLVVDESHYAKNPKAARTKALLRMVWPGLFGKRDPEFGSPPAFPYRRTLTGTPTPQGPFDLWSQMYILSPDILGRVFTTFRARYAEFKKNRDVACPHCRTANDFHPVRSSGRQKLCCRTCGKMFEPGFPVYDELVGYRNLDELRARMAAVTFARRKADCLDLPDRMFVRHVFEMPPEHARVYEQLRRDTVVALESGEIVNGQQVLTCLLRLQQISRGYVGVEGGRTVPLPGDRPAADAVVELVGGNDGKTIVWCRFTDDVNLLEARLRDAGHTVLRCDGSTPATERPALRERFRDDPSATVWLGTLSTGGVGVDLGSANLMVFYSHGFDLAARLQGLERNFGSSQRAGRVDVVDIVAANTVDERALVRLAQKQGMSDLLSTASFRVLIADD